MHTVNLGVYGADVYITTDFDEFKDKCAEYTDKVAHYNMDYITGLTMTATDEISDCVIYISKDLINHHNRAETLAMVIAHECAHAAVSIANRIQYDLQREDEPFAYMLGHLVKETTAAVAKDMGKDYSRAAKGLVRRVRL